MASPNSPNLPQKRNSDAREKLRLRTEFLDQWMDKLAAAYRQEITIETKAMYLDGLFDLPLDRLNLAFERAVRECRFVPTIAEIRAFESDVTVPAEAIEAAHARLRARLAAQPEVKMLASVQDENTQPRQSRREIQPLSREEIERRMDDLLRQREELLRPK